MVHSVTMAMKNSTGPFVPSTQSSGSEPVTTPDTSTMPMDIPIPSFGGLTQTPTNQSVQSSVSDAVSFPTFEPLSAAADGTLDSWAGFPLGNSVNMSDTGSWVFGNEGLTVGQPALTAGSSGTQSEIDEVPPSDDVYAAFGMPSIQEDVSTTTSNPTGNSPQWNRHSLPPSFFGNTDFTSIGANDIDWQTPSDDPPPDTGKLRSQQPAPIGQFDEAWQMGNVPRNLGSLSHPGGRPQSHSVGPSSAPSDDLIRQLFPDIDVAGASLFGSGVTGSPTDMTAAHDDDALVRGVGPAANATSAPMQQHLNGMMDETEYTPASWSDGSIAVPNDDYAPAYDLPQDFASADMSATWAQ